MLSSASPVSADLPLARLSTIFPPGGRAGTEFEVGFTGLDLEHAETVYFSLPGLSGRRLTNEPANSATPRFVVNIASNTAPGLHLLRLGGRFGISNPRPFVVGDGAEILESSTNHEAKSAQALTLGILVNGRAEPNAADYYSFQGNKGDRIIAECASSILDSRLRPVLVLSDRHGAEIVRNREGGLLDCILPEDGAYLIKLHDLVYGGGPEYPYRLLVSSKPRLDFLLPASGVAGTKARFELYGRNLPDGMPMPDWKIAGHPLEMLGVEVEIPSEPLMGSALEMIYAPAAIPVRGFAYRLRGPKGLSNPVLISYATGPVISEEGTNRQNLSAQEVPAPCEVSGQFYPPGAQHWFAFDGKKGEVYYLEVFSHRLGFPTDPFLVVQRQTKNDKGVAQFNDVTEAADEANQGGPEFNTSHRDPQARLEVKEDGRYLVQLRDLFNVRAADPGLLFRLSIRHPAPDFSLAALPQPPSPANKDAKEALLWTPLLRRGEVRPVRVLALRRDNFAGEIALKVEGLPPGVSCDGATIAGNQNSAMLMLVAGDDVTNWAGAIQIIGHSRAGELDLKHQAVGAALAWTVGDYNNEAVRARVVPDFFIATSALETAPLALGPVEKKMWETSVAGRITIPLRVVRWTEDFNGPVKIKMSGLAQFEGKELEIAAKGTNGTLELDLAQAKVPAGQYSFYLEGQSPGKYRRETPEEIKANAAAAELADRQFKEAEKKAGSLAAAAKESSEKSAAAARELEKAEAALKVFREKSAAAKEVSSSGGGAAPGEADLAGQVEKARAAKTEAEKGAQENAAKAKQAGAEKDAAAGRAKETAQKTQAKDVTAVVYSPRFELRVAPSPITLAASVPAVAEVGRKVAVPVSITRFFSYDDAVEVILTPPKGISGIKGAKGTIGKEQTQTTLTVETSSEAPAGRHPLQLQASLRLNGQELKVEQTLEIQLASRAPEP